MLRRPFTLVTMIVCVSLLLAPGTQARDAGVATRVAPDAIGGSPALIIENVGQWDTRARFQVSGGIGTTWLAEDGVWIVLPQAAERPSRAGLTGKQAWDATPRGGVALHLSFEGASAGAQLVPWGRSETVVSFLRGNDPSGWHCDVPVWTGVRYVELYPGLDLEISATSGGWGWRMIEREAGAWRAKPLQDVRLRVDGAEEVSLDGKMLRARTAVGEVSLPLLEAVGQDGTPLALPGPAEQVGSEVVSAPFAAAEGSIVPAVATMAVRYSTMLGGEWDDYAFDVAADATGQAYVTGRTPSSDFPTTPGAFENALADNYDVFVSVLDAAGSGLIYSTYLGGGDWEEGAAIALDSAGRAYVTGRTRSTGFPTTAGALDTVLNGAAAAFVSVLNPTGTALVYSTLLGGSDWDGALDIAVDGAGRATVAGWTYSADYPTTGGVLDPGHNGDADIFVSRLNATGTGLVFSTLLGGSNYEEADALAVDAAGRTYIAGWTSSGDMPVSAAAFDPYLDGDTAAFVGLLNATATGLVYSTLLGGSDMDEVEGMAVDGAGRAFVTGWTSSPDYPTTVGAYDVGNNGDREAFVSVLNGSGSALVYSTYLGGGGWDEAHTLALDSDGRAYVAGWTYSSNFPVTPGALDSSLSGDSAGWLTVLNAAGSELDYSTYLGGASNDEAFGVGLDPAGRAYVVGYTESSDFPTTPGAFGTSYSNGDAFVCVLQTTSPSTHFAPASEWWDGLKYWAPQNRYPRMTGDVDGDGDDDAVAFHPVDGPSVAISTGSTLLKPVNWSSEFAWLQGALYWRALGDVDGDGMDDVVGFKYGDGVYVALSTGTAFASSSEWLDDYQTWGPQSTYPRLVGDVDGDGLADVVAMHPVNGVFVSLSTGSAFGLPAQWSAEAGWMSDERSWVALADVDGDGDDDLVNFRFNEGVYVALSSGSGYGARTLWWTGLKYWGPDTRYPRLVGDVTGDGKADIAAWNPDSGGWVGVSTGSAFIKPALWTTDFAIKANHYNLHALGDMNGDGRADAVCFVYEDGVYVGLSGWE